MARRADLWILVGLFVFGVVFVIGATWLGKQDRVPYGLDPLPALSASEAALVRELGLLTPRWRGALPWVDAGVEQRRRIAADVAARAAGGDRDAVLDLGVLWLLRDEPSQAMLTTMLALRDHPGDGDLLLLQGLVHERMERPAEALSAYGRAAASLGDDVDLLYRRGRLQLQEGRAVEARRCAERAVRLEPRHAEAQRLLGETCLATNDAGRAKRAFLDVLQLRPGDPEAQRQVSILDGTR